MDERHRLQHDAVVDANAAGHESHLGVAERGEQHSAATARARIEEALHHVRDASVTLSDSASSGERSAVTLRGSSTSRLSMSIAAARSVAVEAPSM